MNKSNENSPSIMRIAIGTQTNIIKGLDDAIEELNDAMKVIPPSKRIAYGALWNRWWKLRIERENEGNRLEVLKARLRAIEKEVGE